MILNNAFIIKSTSHQNRKYIIKKIEIIILQNQKYGVNKSHEHNKLY